MKNHEPAPPPPGDVAFCVRGGSSDTTRGRSRTPAGESHQRKILLLEDSRIPGAVRVHGGLELPRRFSMRRAKDVSGDGGMGARWTEVIKAAH